MSYPVGTSLIYRTRDAVWLGTIVGEGMTTVRIKWEHLDGDWWYDTDDYYFWSQVATLCS
jgi:hypothetical protein